MGKHAELAPSAAERWLNCCGCIELIKKCPPSPDSPASLLGTAAHKEHEIMADKVWAGLALKPTPRLRDDADMRAAVMKSIEYIKKIWDPKKEFLFIEEKSELGYIDPELWGTADIVIVEPNEHLKVYDYKHGIGHVVQVVTKKDFGNDHNMQLVIYALGVAKRYNYKFKKVTLGILQPRAKTKTWKREVTITMKELRAYEYILEQGVKRVRLKKKTYFSGSWCYFCPAKDHNCPVQEKLKYDKRVNDFDI